MEFNELKNEYGTFSTQTTPDDVDWHTTVEGHLYQPEPPISNIYIGSTPHAWVIGVDKKFNWFQKKMIKWCFGFEVKENNNETN